MKNLKMKKRNSLGCLGNLINCQPGDVVAEGHPCPAWDPFSFLSTWLFSSDAPAPPFAAWILTATQSPWILILSLIFQ